MRIPAPFDGFLDVVRDEWIDHNQHMNMGYYMVVFDLATDAWFEYLGLGPEHRVEHRVTTFSLEGHITYQREVRAGDPLRFTTRLLGFIVGSVGLVNTNSTLLVVNSRSKVTGSTRMPAK